MKIEISQKHQNWLAMMAGCGMALAFAAFTGNPLSLELGVSGGVLAVLIWKGDL